MPIFAPNASGPMQSTTPTHYGASNCHSNSSSGVHAGRPSYNNNSADARVTNTSRTNLFIRYLPKEVDDDELVRMFSPYGTIATSMVMRDIYTGESLGTAFVRFESPVAAEAARKGMDQAHIYGKKLSIQWARREHDFKTANNDLRKKRMYKLFIRNVPLSVTTDDLGQLLSAYGTVVAVSIHADTQQIESIDGARNSGSRGPNGTPSAAMTPTAKAVDATGAALNAVEEEVAGFPTPADDDGIYDSTKVFVQSPMPQEPSAVSAPPPPVSTATLVRRIAFITFAEDGSAERALKGVHHTCPYTDCDGIPFMGKLINDNLLSKKQQQQQQQQLQQQQTVNGVSGAQPQMTLSPRALAGGNSTRSFALPSPASSRGRNNMYATGLSGSQGSIARSPTTSAGHVSMTEFCPSDAVCNAPVSGRYGSLQPPAANGSGYPTSSRSVTPTSESNSLTPRLATCASGGTYALPGGKVLCSPAGTPSAHGRGLPEPLSARFLQSATNRMSTNSPSAVSPTLSTPSRSQRYSHNPYAGVVIL